MDHLNDKTKIDSVKKISSLKKITVLKIQPRSKDFDEKILKFDKDRIVIGSVISADLRLTGDGIAPIHAVLECTVDSATGKVNALVFDLASETGLFVNGKKVVSDSLKNDDEIIVGTYHIRFSTEDLNPSSGKDRIHNTEDGRALFINPKEDLAPLNLEDERQVIEIFDYRPTSKRCLEVVMSWFGTILRVEHFVNNKQITLGGTTKSDFAIPSLLSPDRYAVATRDKAGMFSLNIDGKMKGVLQQGGKVNTLDQLRNEAMDGSRSRTVSLGNNDFAKLSIGDIDFYFSYTAAPPRLKPRKVFDKDPFFVKVFSFSMLLTTLALFTLSRVKLPQNVDADQVPDRIATILYQPEKYLKPPAIPVPKPKPEPEVKHEVKPEPKKSTPPQAKPVVKVTVTPVAKPAPHKEIPKVMNVNPEPKKPTPVKAPTAPAKSAPKAHAEREAKEGEGARAKGKEGTRGDIDKKKTSEHVTKLSRPSPKTGKSGGQGDSQVPDEGNVDILKGAGGKIQNILGNSAAHMGEGGEKIKGIGSFSTGGSGGLALAGSGEGGGGDAETTLGGLGKKGNGMGRVGTGKGAAGNGNGIVGSHARIAIQTEGPEEAVVMGSIDRDAIADAINAHKDEFRLCYEREINAEHPGITGQIGTSFVIGSSGRVTQAGVESSSLHNPSAERCVITVLKRIHFPMPNGGGIVEVHFPFKFNSVGH